MPYEVKYDEKLKYSLKKLSNISLLLVSEQVEKEYFFKLRKKISSYWLFVY